MKPIKDDCLGTQTKKMKTIFTIILAVTSGLVFSSVHAEIYTCKDAAGHLLTSDRPIPECANRSMFVRKTLGQNPREIPAPLTPEERRKADEEQEKQKSEMLLEEQQKREDQHLLANYKSESDIELARQRSLEFVKEKIRAGNDQIKAIAVMQAEFQSEQQRNAKKSTEQNVDLQRRSGQLSLASKNAQSTVAEYEAERTRINTQFDEILKRYREIVQKRKGGGKSSS